MMQPRTHLPKLEIVPPGMGYQISTCLPMGIAPSCSIVRPDNSAGKTARKNRYFILKQKQ